mgnify:CR=1 FL=1
MGKTSKRLHKKMWSIHNWVGLYAGVVIAVLSITGVLALFKTEIDVGLNNELYKVVVPENAVRMDVTPIIDSLHLVYGDKNPVSVAVPKQPDDVWMYTTSYRKSALDFVGLQIFIDPYSGKVLGQRNYFKTLAYYIRNIHVRLYEGFFGRYLVGIAGLALLLSTITGFWIYGGFMKKQFFASIRKKNLRITMADYHKVIGITTLVFNMVIAITGTWLGLQGLIQKPLIGPRPGTYQVDEKPISKEADAEIAVNYMDIYQRSRALFPEMEPSFIFVSSDGSRTISVRGDVPRTAIARTHFQLTLDKSDLSELHRLDIRKEGLGTKLFYIQESMHFGDWGGIFLKIVYAFFGITSGFLALTGFVVYLKRTERKQREKPKFVELKPLLLRWTYSILAGMALLLALSLWFCVAIPTLVVVIALYGFLLFLLIRAIVLFFIRRMQRLKLRVR